MHGALKLTRGIAAFAVHLLTASGAGVAVLALAAAVESDFSAMFALLGLALFIDGVDGPLARAVAVETYAPWIDGKTLDFVVDYLTYVLAPLIALWRSGLLGETTGLWLCALVAAASSMYFADRRMKTADNWFRGFPALWNVVALYLFVFRLPALVSVLIVLVLTAMMFAPIKFVHPTRSKQLSGVTLVMTMAWLVSAALAVAEGLDGSFAAKVGLAVTGAYFVGLSAWRSGADMDRT